MFATAVYTQPLGARAGRRWGPYAPKFLFTSIIDNILICKCTTDLLSAP